MVYFKYEKPEFQQIFSLNLLLYFFDACVLSVALPQHTHNILIEGTLGVVYIICLIKIGYQNFEVMDLFPPSFILIEKEDNIETIRPRKKNSKLEFRTP
jgi:hypothetical protein